MIQDWQVFIGVETTTENGELAVAVVKEGEATSPGEVLKFVIDTCEAEGVLPLIEMDSLSFETMYSDEPEIIEDWYAQLFEDNHGLWFANATLVKEDEE